MIAAYDSAPRMSQIVVSIDDMPPRENSSSIGAMPVVDTNPLAIAAYSALMPADQTAAPPANAATSAGWVNQASTPGEQRAGEDRQERRRLPDREDDQQHQRQQVERA